MILYENNQLYEYAKFIFNSFIFKYFDFFYLIIEIKNMSKY